MLSKGLNTMTQNIELLSDNTRIKLTAQQKTVIAGFESGVKFRAVLKWRERMARGSITGRQIAKDVGLPYTRISEYLNFKKEPNEKRFLAIEKAIYNRGV